MSAITKNSVAFLLALDTLFADSAFAMKNTFNSNCSRTETPE